MNKQQFVDVLAERIDQTKADAERALKGVIDLITECLVKGEDVEFTGFGKFSKGERAARTGRNPQTGETIQIKASRTAKFKAGKGLKDAIQD